ncbi:hypothetical protein Tco_0878991 [Tanacetum coccineum]
MILEAKLKNEIECCVLLSHECVNNNVQDEIEKIQRDSIEIQEGMQKQINILENDVLRCQKQSLDFELQIQHEKERRKCESSLKTVCENSWISKMKKLENENVSLEFKVQSFIKERENVKLEYQQIFDSIKKTQTQTQTQTQREINELIEHVNQKTCADIEVRVENQDLLITISELKTKLKNVEKGKSVNTKVDKTNVSNKILCVTPHNYQVFQKKIIAPKTEEKHVLSKTVTLQTSPNKQKAVETNKNGIALAIGCSKHMTGDHTLLENFVEKFIGIVRFGNDHFTAITGYDDYVQGKITVCHVYYVEGLGHNLFSVGQFCDGDLEVAFHSKTCYVRNLEGDDLLTGAHESNLYTISISDMVASLPICLMSKATLTKSWL